MVHLILSCPSRTRWLNFDLLTLDFGLIKVFHCFLRIPHIVKLDKFVVLLVGRFSNLFDLTMLSKCSFQLLVASRGIKVENDQGALVLIFLRGIVFGDGVVDIELATADEFPLEVSHGVLGMADVVVGYHDKASVLALGVHGPDGPVHLEEGR